MQVQFASQSMAGSAPPMAAAEGDGTSLELAGRSVMVVEDQVIVAMDIQFGLEEAGAKVFGPAHRLGEAVDMARARAGTLDAAVLDVDLHGEDVFPVADILQEAGVPFMFQTGHAARADLEARWPDAPVCTKPLMLDDLIATLKRILKD